MFQNTNDTEIIYLSIKYIQADFSIMKKNFLCLLHGVSSRMQIDCELDITNDNCPMTFVRTKVQLEKMSTGQILSVILQDGEPMVNVPRAVRDHGHEIIEIAEKQPGIFRIIIKVS